MDEKQLKATFNSMEKKLGKEGYAKIADDIGIMMSANAQTLKELEKRDNEINELRTTNESLVLSNGNLLKQVAMAPDPTLIKSEEIESKPFNMRDAFDVNGNLKH